MKQNVNQFVAAVGQTMRLGEWVRDSEELAVLDAIMFGVGFYQEPIEALASRDPGKTTEDKPPVNVHSDNASG